MKWTGEIEPMVYEYPISSLDILPTIAALTHAPLLADRPLDGVNIIPYLKGEKKEDPIKPYT